MGQKGRIVMSSYKSALGWWPRIIMSKWHLCTQQPNNTHYLQLYFRGLPKMIWRNHERFRFANTRAQPCTEVDPIYRRSVLANCSTWMRTIFTHLFYRLLQLYDNLWVLPSLNAYCWKWQENNVFFYFFFSWHIWWASALKSVWKLHWKILRSINNFSYVKKIIVMEQILKISLLN